MSITNCPLLTWRLKWFIALDGRVLGRILKRVPLQLYPDTFLAEPEIAPSQVAAMVGYDPSPTNCSSYMSPSWVLRAVHRHLHQPVDSAAIGKQIFLADDDALHHPEP